MAELCLAINDEVIREWVKAIMVTNRATDGFAPLIYVKESKQSADESAAGPRQNFLPI